MSAIPSTRAYVASVLLAGVAALGLAVPVQAQTQSTSGESDKQSGLDEIVVTAQRKSENLQDVPISVSSVSGGALAGLGAADSLDLALAVPAVTINQGPGGGNVTIRGVGGTGSGGDEPGNAIYLDGVYQFAPSSVLFSLAGIERVEVLKGPQGTLYGRNASGGVVHVITKDPGRNAEANFSATYGNFDTISGMAYVNVPLGEQVAVNLSAYGTKQNDGWGVNTFTGKEAHKGSSYGIRGKLKWDSGEGTELVLAFLNNFNRPPTTGGQNRPGTVNLLAQNNTGFYNLNQNLEPDLNSRQTTISGTLKQDLGFAKLVSITAYDWVKTNFDVDQDYSPRAVVNGNLRVKFSTFSQELQLQSLPDSDISWLLGLYYLNNSRDDSTYTTGAFAPPPVKGRNVLSAQNAQSYAAFGQITVPVSQSTNITAGLRYTIDRRSFEGKFVYDTGTGTPQAGTTVLFQPNGRAHEDSEKLTWRLAIDQKLSDQVMAYASYSRGYKSGLFNSIAPADPSVKPQTIDAYELGVKAETADRKLRFNLSGFYYDFKDIQVRFVVTGATVFQNAAKARFYGLDADLTAAPIDGLKLTASATIVDGKYKTYDNAPNFAFRPVANVNPLVPPSVGSPVIQTAASAAGKDTINTPPIVLSLSAAYAFETSIGKFTLASSFNHNGGYFFDPSNFAEQRPYSLLNANVGWASSDGMFDVTLWAKNITREKYFVNMETSTSGSFYFPGSPRTYGLTIGAHF